MKLNTNTFNFLRGNFNEDNWKILDSEDYVKDWPIVYLIFDQKRIYIGISEDVGERFKSHKKNQEKESLTEFLVISSAFFNRSVIYELESILINYFFSDQKFQVLNRSKKFFSFSNYFQNTEYQIMFSKIVQKLYSQNFFQNKLSEIESDELFKFSPFKLLDQQKINFFEKIKEQIWESNTNFIIEGGAKSGKTALAIDIFLKLLNFDLEKETKLLPGAILKNDHLNIAFYTNQDYFKNHLQRLLLNYRVDDPDLYIVDDLKLRTTSNDYQLIIVDNADDLIDYIWKNGGWIKRSKYYWLKEKAKHLILFFNKLPWKAELHFTNEEIDDLKKYNLLSLNSKITDDYLQFIADFLQLNGKKTTKTKYFINKRKSFKLYQSTSYILDKFKKLNSQKDCIISKNCAVLYPGYIVFWEIVHEHHNFNNDNHKHRFQNSNICLAIDQKLFSPENNILNKNLKKTLIKSDIYERFLYQNREISGVIIANDLILDSNQNVVISPKNILNFSEYSDKFDLDFIEELVKEKYYNLLNNFENKLYLRIYDKKLAQRFKDFYQKIEWF